MNTEQKLTKIRAKCVELLAIAENRTHGIWGKRDKFGSVYSGFQNRDLICVCSFTSTFDEEKRNADFIASCAGPAEAGWKATICAIDYLMNYASDQLEEEEAREEIIAAWEGLV